MPSSLDLLDVDVWLSLTVPDHTHHARARRYWDEESGRELAFCRITALALVRHLMNPVIMQDGVLAGAEAWAQYLRWRALPGVVFRAEPDRLEDRLGEICLTGGFGHRGLTDAYLAAFARSAGCRMVSFDGAFRRFETLDFLHLEP